MWASSPPLAWARGLCKWPLALVLFAALSGCATTPAARKVADVSGFKAEVAAVHTRIDTIAATTNYDSDVWFNRGLLLLAGVLGWRRLRAARQHATHEALRYGYWQQRHERLSRETQQGSAGRAPAVTPDCTPPVFDDVGEKGE